MATLASVGGADLSVDIEKRFPGGETIRVSFTIPGNPPRVSILFGPSGAGKTTILRCLAGLEPITRGRIRHGDEMWSDPETGVLLPPQKRSVGYLFQDYALFPHLDVRRNIGYGLGGLRGAERAARVETACSMLSLDHLVDRKPGQLSGGQQQRGCAGSCPGSAARPAVARRALFFTRRGDARGSAVGVGSPAPATLDSGCCGNP